MASSANLPREEVTRLQRCINDLISVLAFPAIWAGRSPAQMLGSFLDGLLRVLQLDVAYARVVDGTGGAFDCLRAPPDVQAGIPTLTRWFGSLSNDPGSWPAAYAAEGIRMAIESTRLGLPPGRGVIAVGSRRAGFPFLTEKLLLNVAANQLLIGLQEAQLRSERERAAQQGELSQIINTIPALAWSARPDGSAEFFSEHYLAYVGLPAAQLMGGGWQTLIHPDDCASLFSTWQSIMATGTRGEVEARIRRFDGEYRWFLQRANPMLDASGKVVKWYGINTDIHDRRQAEDQRRSSEEALSKARAELANVTRVSSLGVLTASIAHEVNQPLSGIMTNAGACLRMLSTDPPNIEGALETARRTIRDGRRASDVIARLRTLYTGKELQREVMDLNEAAREVISLSVNELQHHRVSVNLELQDDLPRVDGDRIQLQQVILNLVRNALDAMQAVADRPRELLIRTDRLNQTVRLCVRDSGVGFTANSADRIFEPFYTTKSDGMGIGLSVSRSIIEAHHGRLWATPNEGPGAEFAFSLRSVAPADGLDANDWEAHRPGE